MQIAYTRRPLNRTLAAIDGGLNITGDTPMPPTNQKPELLEQVRQHPDAAL